MYMRQEPVFLSRGNITAMVEKLKCLRLTLNNRSKVLEFLSMLLLFPPDDKASALVREPLLLKNYPSVEVSIWARCSKYLNEGLE
jgi:hypothetical protein